MRLLAPARALLLDVTGTLLTFSEPVGVTYQATARQVGLSPLPAPEAFEAAFKSAFRSQWKAFPCYGFGSQVTEEKWWKNAAETTLTTCFPHGPLPSSARDSFLEEIYAHYGKPSAYHVYSDTWDLLEFAKRKGMLVGILTNSSQRTIELLAYMDLQPYVHVAMSCQIIGHAKPSPAAFDCVFRKLQMLDSSLQCEQVLHIGDDSVQDFEGATAAGMQAVLLRRVDAGSAIGVARHHRHVHSLGNVVELLQSS